VVGLIAYAAVALFYSGFDWLAARGTLYTVDLLGKALWDRLVLSEGRAPLVHRLLPNPNRDQRTRPR